MLLFFEVVISNGAGRLQSSFKVVTVGGILYDDVLINMAPIF